MEFIMLNVGQQLFILYFISIHIIYANTYWHKQAVHFTIILRFKTMK